MKLLTKSILLLVLAALSGCAFLKSLKQDSPSARIGHPSFLKTDFEGTLIYYKDLSNPCDEATVAWNDLNKFTSFEKASLTTVQIDCNDVAGRAQSVAAHQFEVQQQFSIPFETRKTELLENWNAKNLDSLSDVAITNTLIQIHGAAGTVGKRSEALGLERASAVRDRLITMGVQSERIKIMPYDPKIPGLQALVKVLVPVIL